MLPAGSSNADDMLDYQQTRQRLVWQPMPQDVEFLQPPQESQAMPRYTRILWRISCPILWATSTCFLGLGNGEWHAFRHADEMLAAELINSGGDHVATMLKQVIEWLKEMFGFPAQASGLLVSGASMANLVGLTVARNTCAGYDVRKLGLGAAPQDLVLYASREVHSCVQKAVELLGLGSQALRLIPVNEA
jgi:hypothetical protein